MELNTFIRKIYGPRFNFHTLLMFLLSFTTASAEFFVIYYVGVIIDAVASGYEKTMRYCEIIFIGVLVLIICSTLLTYFCSKMKIKLSYSLQTKIGEKICSARYEAIETIDDGELLSIATKDIEGLKAWLDVLLKMGYIPAKIGLVMIIVFHMSWKFLLITLWLFPLAAIPEFTISKKIGRYHSEEKKAYDKVLSLFTTILDFILVIKSFQLERLFKQKNDKVLKAYKKARIKRQLSEQLVQVYGRCFGHVTNPLLLFCGAYFIFSGEMSLGMLTSIMLLVNFLGDGLNALNQVPISLQAGKASIEHIKKLLNIEDELEKRREDFLSSGQKDRLVYEVRGLNYQYGDRIILNNICFEVKSGEKIAIVGSSGCGKTTLFKLLSGLYSPGEGQILFYGKDISKLSSDDIKSNLSVTTQESFIFSASFKENIAMRDKEIEDEKVMQAGKLAQIDEFINAFSEGYDTEVNTTVQSISNGQMQRINLARAFYNDADVFLFDEPTSALDRENTKCVLDSLFNTYADKTVMMILHNLEEIDRFDKVLVLDEGDVVGFDSHEHLMSQCEVYQRLYRQAVAHEKEVCN